MDLRLLNGAVFQVVGPSGCGKSHFVCRLLQNSELTFQKPIRNIFWLMGSEEGELGDTQKEMKALKNVRIVPGFVKGWQSLPQKDDAIVIDDLYAESTKEQNFNNMFTKVARHRGVTVIFITQNLFHQGGQHRTRNLNVHYLTLFKNPRDCTAIDYVSRQAFTNNKNFLIDAYQDATEGKPHGYLFVDFTQTCPDFLRVRTDIFNANGMTVYKQS